MSPCLDGLKSIPVKRSPLLLAGLPMSAFGEPWLDLSGASLMPDRPGCVFFFSRKAPPSRVSFLGMFAFGMKFSGLPAPPPNCRRTAAAFYPLCCWLERYLEA